MKLSERIRETARNNPLARLEVTIQVEGWVKEVALLERELAAYKLLNTASRVGDHKYADKALSELEAIQVERAGASWTI